MGSSHERTSSHPMFAVMPLVTVVIAGLCGLSWPRLAILTGVLLVAHLGFRSAPAPGSCPRDHDGGHPLVFAALAIVTAVAVTGGLSSPMMVLLPAQIVMAWTVYGPTRHAIAVVVTIIAALPVLMFLPRSWTGSHLDRPAFEGLVAWFSFIAVMVMSKQIFLLFGGLRTTSASLERVRGGVLDDAARRRRGLETVGAKLAHELKNPLAAIKSLLQLERSRGHGDDTSARRFGVLMDEVSRMEELIRDYLSYSRPLDELEPAEVELTAVLDEIVTVLEGRAETAGVRLTRRGRGGRVHVDPRRLKEALLNLTANAIEATPRGGAVELRHDVVEQVARLVISDTGPGMTAEVVARIGTPFFTTRADGTGLGVVLARNVIVQHGGTLDFSPRPGGGTNATIVLPPHRPLFPEVLHG